jgi:hypothetical protein
MRLGVIFLIGMLCLACTRTNKPKKPEQLISKEVMADILFDLFIINGTKSINKKIMNKVGFVPEAYILNKYTIDSTQFAESNTYYAFYPDEYRDIIEKVKQHIEQAKDSLLTIEKDKKERIKRKRDSVQRLNSAKTKLKDTIPSETKIIQVD